MLHLWSTNFLSFVYSNVSLVIELIYVHCKKHGKFRKRKVEDLSASAQNLEIDTTARGDLPQGPRSRRIGTSFPCNCTFLPLVSFRLLTQPYKVPSASPFSPFTTGELKLPTRTLHHPRRWLGCHPRPPEHAVPLASCTRSQDLLSELGAASLSARARSSVCCWPALRMPFPAPCLHVTFLVGPALSFVHQTLRSKCKCSCRGRGRGQISTECLLETTSNDAARN